MSVWQVCAEFRREHGYTLRNVADEVGCTAANVCAFEHGNNRNLNILMWYVRHGLVLDLDTGKRD